MSKMSPKKALKKRRKQKANLKRRNIERNKKDPVWRLDVLIDGKWYTARKYSRIEQVNAHMADTEARRKAGEVIVPGKLIRIATGEVVKEIEPSGEQPLTAKGPLDAKEIEPVDKPKKGVLGKIFGKSDAKHRIGEGDAQ
jgi:hypothetical protein